MELRNLPQSALVSPRTGEKQRKRKRTAGPANKGDAASDGKTEIQMPATLQ